MIKSMTGFASTNTEIDVAAIGVTVRSVNHRYLDLQLRTPSILGEVESKLRTLVQTKVARGRIELALTIRMTTAPAVDVSWNAPLVEALRGAVRQAEERDLSAGGLATGDLLRFPQAVVVQEREPEADTVRAVQTAVLAEVERALGELDTMRRREGDYLRADLDQRRGTVGSLVNAMAEAAKAGQEGLVLRLGTRIEELGANPNADEASMAQEIVRFAARSDVSEELTRLRGHLEHWCTLSDSPDPCGRQLDFLLQEMNREVNTLGAKIEGPQISELIVAAKAELEKLREQTQNVE